MAQEPATTYSVTLDNGDTIEIPDQRPGLEAASTDTLFCGRVIFEDIEADDPTHELLMELKTWLAERMIRIVTGSSVGDAEEEFWGNLNEIVNENAEKSIRETTDLDDDEIGYEVDMRGEMYTTLFRIEMTPITHIEKKE